MEKSIRSVLGALAAIRDRPSVGPSRESLRPELKLVSLVAVLLMVSLSRTLLFLEAAAAFELACLCLLPAPSIARALEKALAALLFALAISLPALLAGGGAVAALLVSKVLLAVLAAAIFSATTSWPSIVSAFAALRAPGILVMTLDLTVKYVSLLGGLLLDLLHALELRSVGRDERKAGSLSGVAGTLFLRSKEAAEEQYQAMECRCFSGGYRPTRRRGFGWRDAAFASLVLALAAAFFSFGARR